MTATTMPSLRPLGLGELLDQAIRLYRRNFFKFIGIVAVVQLPLTLIQFIISMVANDQMTAPFLSANTQNPEEIFTAGYWASMASLLGVAVLSFILIQGVATAALTRAVADSRMGQSTGITDVYSKIGASWLSVLGALILIGIISIGLTLWMLVPCIGWFTGIGMLVYFPYIVGALVAPVIVLEQRGAGAAVRRAWDLSRRRFWAVIGFMFILYLFSLIVVSGPTSLISFVLSLSLNTSPNPQLQLLMTTVIQSISQLVLSLLYLPLQLTAVTLLYLDLRVRTEGFDLALMSSSEGMDVSSFLAQAPPVSSEKLITGTELGYFALLTILMGLVYGILLGVISVIGVTLFSAGTGGL